MKKACILLIVFVLSGSLVKAQISDYYADVHSSEKNIINGNYQEASINYQKAFALNFTPFTIDIYNAACCNAHTKDYNELLSYAKLLVLKGADSSFFKKHIFNGFRHAVQWQDLLASYPDLIAKRKFDTALIRKIKLLVDVDQATHCLNPKLYNDSVFVSKMHHLDDSLSKILDSLFEKNSLSEKNIGSEFVDTIFNPEPIYSVLVVHEFQKQGKNLKTLVKKSVKNGLIKSDIVLEWLEFSYDFFYTIPYFIYNDTLRVDTTIGHDAIVEMLKKRKPTPQNLVLIKKHENDLPPLLLSLTPSERVLKIRDEYFMDSPENIIDKIIYNYRVFVNRKTGNEFIIYPMLNFFHGEMERSRLDGTKIIY